MNNKPSGKSELVCIISNYNYGRFLEDAVRSCLLQDPPFKRIIIVDDGSSDGGQQIGRELSENYPNVSIMCKENGGQLSAIRAGLTLTEDSEIVSLLDADDVLHPGYTKEVQALKKGKLLFARRVAFRKTSSESDEQIDFPDDLKDQYESIACPNAISALVQNCWIGISTSGISGSSGQMKQLISRAKDSEWRTRADDVIIFTAAYLGAERAFATTASFGYRIHDSQNFRGKRQGLCQVAIREHAVFRIFCEMTGQNFYQMILIRGFVHHSHTTNYRGVKVWSVAKFYLRALLSTFGILARKQKSRNACGLASLTAPQL